MLFRCLERARGYLMPFPFWQSNLGKQGEYLARRHYHRRGYHLVAQNWVFERGEIDLIMANGEKLLFLEVKTRTKKPDRGISDVLTWNQEKRLLALARAYVRALGLSCVAWDLELVFIVLNQRKIREFQTARIRD